jgi:hypothetical protein
MIQGSDWYSRKGGTELQRQASLLKNVFFFEMVE